MHCFNIVKFLSFLFKHCSYTRKKMVGGLTGLTRDFFGNPPFSLLQDGKGFFCDVMSECRLRDSGVLGRWLETTPKSDSKWLENWAMDSPCRRPPTCSPRQASSCRCPRRARRLKWSINYVIKPTNALLLLGKWFWSIAVRQRTSKKVIQ